MRSKGSDLGGMLGLPVIPELLPRDIRVPLDIGDHLLVARSSLAGRHNGAHESHEHGGEYQPSHDMRVLRKGANWGRMALVLRMVRTMD